MDFKNLTKAELITKIEELTKTLAMQSHLSDAVDAKDAELHKQQLVYNDTLLKIEKEKIKAIQDLEALRANEIKRIKEDFEKKESSMNYEIQDLRGKLQQNENYDKVLEQNKVLISEVQRLGKFVNVYTQSFRNFMKGIQGSLDNTIELEALLIENLQKN